MVACWALGAHTKTTPRAAGGLAVVLVLLLADVDSLVDWLFIVLLLGAPWLGGVLVRRYRLLVAELERQREENERYAVAVERGRIAREMHDVLAHTLSTIAIQAEAAAQLLDRPERARPWLDSIGVSVREAMSEVRLLVGALREADPECGQQPAGEPAGPSIPGLADLPRLVAQTHSPALTARMALPKRLPPLPPTSGLAAHRIVQEALSNVRRHAQASAVVVEVAVEADSVEVSVVDDGIGPPGVELHGHGIRGMVERAELCGGSLSAGAGSAGGFEVRARLPRGMVLS